MPHVVLDAPEGIGAAGGLQRCIPRATRLMGLAEFTFWVVENGSVGWHKCQSHQSFVGSGTGLGRLNGQRTGE